MHIPFRYFLSSALVLLLALSSGLPGIGADPADAQYGGISALFVSTSPDSPGYADFTGLGCDGDHEVVLYWPGLQPTSQDPSATQSVPGRILAVTRSVQSADPLLNGTFSFPNVLLPTDVEPGVYEVHARCGRLDLRVLIQITSDGNVTINPDPTTPVTNKTPTTSTGINGPLPLTGGEPSRIISLGAGFLAMGLAMMALARRKTA